MVTQASGNWMVSVLLLAGLALGLPLRAETVYETVHDFVRRAFGEAPPGPAVVWLSGVRKVAIRELLGHDYPALRVRYWCRAARSAWVLDEIGKDLPITVGVIVERRRIGFQRGRGDSRRFEDFFGAGRPRDERGDRVDRAKHLRSVGHP